jgi:hypothetical protein
MDRQRNRRALPGSNPLLLPTVLVALLFCPFAVVATLNIISPPALEDQAGRLSPPFVHWALTTPLGMLAVALVSGLFWSVPWVLLMFQVPVVIQPTDVTELPLGAWPHPVNHRRRLTPAGGTRAARWLGQGRAQRTLSGLALLLAALLAGSLAAMLAVTVWYWTTHIPAACAVAGCPPDVAEQLLTLPMTVAIATMLFFALSRIAWVQLRCGVCFRTRVWGPSLENYIRRPGVSAEAAAAALQRYASKPRHIRPTAQVAGMLALFLIPPFLLLCSAELLSAWLATQ